MKRFIKNADIEARAEEVLHEYERMIGVVMKPPIPLEELLMQVFQLHVLWDEIDAEEGVTVFGGLSPSKKLIVLNESQRDLFDSTPGFERSTIGHEAGHWEYSIDKNSIDHPVFPEFLQAGIFLESSSKRHGRISAFRGNVKIDQHKKAILELLKKYDDSDEARVVNRFAAALSMPHYLLKESVRSVDLTKWSSLYKLREEYDVSITALKVRLEQLEYIYLKGKTIYRSKGEASGQESLGL